MSLQQTIDEQKEKFEKSLNECAGIRTPPLMIEEISWTALRNGDGYSIGMKIKGKDTLCPHRFSLPSFDLEQNGQYLRDILNGWFSQIEKTISV
jgi:hypothetical protein